MDVTYQKENQDPNDPNTYFMPRPLTNLTLEDEMQSLAPITDFVVENLLKRDRPQLYMLTGAGTRSTLRILNHGLGTTQFSEEINVRLRILYSLVVSSFSSRFRCYNTNHVSATCTDDYYHYYY